MVESHNNPVAANVLGVLGAVCWSIQLIPQIIVNYRRHHTEGLQTSMMMLWAIAGAPLAVYNVVKNFNVALKIQPQILTTLSLVTWTQCCYYGKKWPIAKCIAILTPIVVFMAGVEAALIIALRIAEQRSLTWPSTLMAVLAGALLCTGVATHYRDIYRHRTVRGVSFLFCGIDAAGDIFSLASVAFEPTLDIAAMIVYASEFTLWSGIFICGFCFNFLPWAARKLEDRATTATAEEHDLQARGAEAEGVEHNVQVPERGEPVFMSQSDAERRSTPSSRRASQLSQASASLRSGMSSSTSVFRTASGDLAVRRLQSLRSTSSE